MNTISSTIIQFSAVKKKLYIDTEPRKVSQLIFSVNKSFAEIVGDVRKMAKKWQKMSASWRNHGYVWGSLMTK